MLKFLSAPLDPSLPSLSAPLDAGTMLAESAMDGDMEIEAVESILNQLEIDIPLTNPAPRVLVAMSGGVDSSVVAAALKYKGYDVVGVTLQLYNHGTASGRKGACCAGADIDDAKKVAHKIGVPHYVLDYEDRFSQAVIDDFVDSYLRGETPLPCVRCNQTVKFTDLYGLARNMGAVALATGHYVRRVVQQGVANMLTAPHSQKDQSYFLFATSREQLAFLRFPLGNISKDSVRRLARFFGLLVADKPDSQDICFVPKGDYRAVVAAERPSAARRGDIVLKDGTVIGQHDGVAGFTVGQRRGLMIGGRKKKMGDNNAAGEHAPLFVLAVDPDSHRVVVGDQDDLKVDSVTLREVGWLVAPFGGDPTHEGASDGDRHGDGAVITTRITAGANKEAEVLVKFRSTMQPIKSRLLWVDGQWRVRFDQPQLGVAAGQALVVYRPLSPTLMGDRVMAKHVANEDSKQITATNQTPAISSWQLLGGGFITRDHLRRFL